MAKEHAQADAECHLEPEPELAEEDGVDSVEIELRAELEPLRVKALEKRAAAEGVDAAAVEDALDEDNTKAALIELIVAAVQQRGPADRLLSCPFKVETLPQMPLACSGEAMHVFEQLR